TPPPLPQSLSAATEEQLFRGPYSLASLIALIDDQHTELNDPTYTDFTGAGPQGWTQDSATGAMKVGDTMYFRVGKAFGADPGVPGIFNGRSFTIETELKLLPDSDDEALVLEYGDVKGSAVIAFSKDHFRVLSSELDMDAKRVAVDLTDDF